MQIKLLKNQVCVGFFFVECGMCVNFLRIILPKNKSKINPIYMSNFCLRGSIFGLLKSILGLWNSILSIHESILDI